MFWGMYDHDPRNNQPLFALFPARAGHSGEGFHFRHGHHLAQRQPAGAQTQGAEGAQEGDVSISHFSSRLARISTTNPR